MHTTSRLGAAAVTVGMTLGVGLSIPASASAAEPVNIEVATSFIGPSYFTSNLDGCSSGEVFGDRGRLAGHDRFGIFNGFKVFECDEGGSFTIRLHATFNDSGAFGTWAFVGGDLVGNGWLVGTPVPDGITDVYVGTVR